MTASTAATTAPADVTTINGLWQDAQRDRAVPYKIYLPKTLPAGTTIPVIVFSHGLTMVLMRLPFLFRTGYRAIYASPTYRSMGAFVLPPAFPSKLRARTSFIYRRAKLSSHEQERASENLIHITPEMAGWYSQVF